MQLSDIVKNLKLSKDLEGLIQKNSLNQFIIFECDDFVLLDCFVQNLCENMLEERGKIVSKSHPDIMFFPIDEKKGLTVEDVGKIINESIVRPIEEDKKIFIIKNSNNLSAATQNKLLKTFEEPNKNVFYFLLTRSLGGVLPTIQSRALKIKLEKLSKAQFMSLGFSNEEFVIYGGNLEKKQCETKNAEIFNACLETLKKLSSSENLLYVSRVLLGKNDLEQIIESFSTIFSSIINEKINPSGVFADVAPFYSIQAIPGILEALDKAKQKIKFNCNQQAILDCLLIKIIEERARWEKKN